MANSGLLIPNPAPTLAIVTHDVQQRKLLSDALRSSGLIVWEAEGELAFYKELVVRRADMVLVDGDLPDGVAPEMLRYLASTGRFSLIGLSDPKQMDIIRSAGAQWCVGKPVDLKALLYGIVMLWENQQQIGQGQGWSLSPEQTILIAPDGRSMCLTVAEQRFVAGLMACAGQILSKDQLVTLLWGEYSERDYHGIEVLLSRLRSKAQKELGQGLPIQAVQAVGLLFYGRVVPMYPET